MLQQWIEIEVCVLGASSVVEAGMKSSRPSVIGIMKEEQSRWSACEGNGYVWPRGNYIQAEI